jgi:DNA-binding XRE family transcriptional regulator
MHSMAMSTSSKLGRQVKTLRLEKGWSQAKMAAFLGVSTRTVVQLEHGRKVWELTVAKVDRRVSELQPQAAVA